MLIDFPYPLPTPTAIPGSGEIAVRRAIAASVDSAICTSGICKIACRVPRGSVRGIKALFGPSRSAKAQSFSSLRSIASARPPRSRVSRSVRLGAIHLLRGAVRPCLVYLPIGIAFSSIVLVISWL